MTPTPTQNRAAATANGCPVPHKRALPDEETAIRAAIRASRKYGGPWRHYPCDCGYWHLSTQPTRRPA